MLIKSQGVTESDSQDDHRFHPCDAWQGWWRSKTFCPFLVQNHLHSIELFFMYDYYITRSFARSFTVFIIFEKNAFFITISHVCYIYDVTQQNGNKLHLENEWSY